MQNDRTAIFPMELDIWIPDLKIGIEYDGDYWHSLENMRKRDIEKDKICEEKGISLIRVKESDYSSNKQDVLNKIQLIILNKKGI